MWLPIVTGSGPCVVFSHSVCFETFRENLFRSLRMFEDAVSMQVLFVLPEGNNA